MPWCHARVMDPPPDRLDVLVVDDDGAVATLVAAVLQREGLVVGQAADGQTRGAGTHQPAVDLQPGRVAQAFQAVGGGVGLHLLLSLSDVISIYLEITK